MTTSVQYWIQISQDNCELWVPEVAGGVACVVLADDHQTWLITATSCYAKGANGWDIADPDIRSVRFVITQDLTTSRQVVSDSVGIAIRTGALAGVEIIRAIIHEGSGGSLRDDNKNALLGEIHRVTNGSVTIDWTAQHGSAYPGDDESADPDCEGACAAKLLLNRNIDQAERLRRATQWLEPIYTERFDPGA